MDKDIKKTVKKSPKVKQNVKKQPKTLAVSKQPKASKKVTELIQPIKSKIQESKKPVQVGIFLMRSSGNLEFFLSEPFSLIQIDNCAYEWNPHSEYVFTHDDGKQQINCGYFYEGNPKAQKIKRGITPEAYQIEGKMVDGKDLMNKMELAVLGMGMAEKASKEKVITEGNIKWLWVMIAVVVVAIIVIYVMGGV